MKQIESIKVGVGAEQFCQIYLKFYKLSKAESNVLALL